MCGFAGIVGGARRGTLREMVQVQRHRGPDDQAIHLSGGVGLAFQRLSIVDPEGGRQPLFNEDGSVWLVCNGEIYNEPEIRRDLEASGHVFRTGSDCEVLVHAWEE